MKKIITYILAFIMLSLFSSSWAAYEIIPLHSSKYPALRVDKKTGESWVLLPRYQLSSWQKALRFIFEFPLKDKDKKRDIWDIVVTDVWGANLDLGLEYSLFKGKNNTGVEQWQKEQLMEILGSEILPLEKNEKGVLAIRTNKRTGKSWVLCPSHGHPSYPCTWYESYVVERALFK